MELQLRSCPPVTSNCSYCQQAHFSGECNTVTSPDERKQILRRLGRCFICLKKFHVSKNCRSLSRCHKCGGKHHTSICFRGSSRGSRTDNKVPEAHSSHVQVLSTSQPPGLSPQANAFVSTTTAMRTNSKTAILLQTARADVYNPLSPWSHVSNRVLLAIGSQSSYVTHCLQRSLALPVLKRQKMLIKTFGSEREEGRVCDVVRIGLRTVSRVRLELPLYSVSMICEPLSHQPISLCKTTCDHLTPLNLADFDDGGAEMPVDILIGSDHYWTVVTGEVVHGETGPIAIGTHLRWMLSGPTCCADEGASAINVITAHTLRIDSHECES